MASDGLETAVVCIAAGDDGCFYTLRYAGREGNYTLSRLDVQGETLDSMSLELGDEYIRDVNATADGEILFNGISTVILAQWQEGVKKIAEAPNRGWFESAALTREGLLLYAKDGIYTLDTETGVLVSSGVPTSDDSGESYRSLAGCQGLTGELISNTGSSLYEYDGDSGTLAVRPGLGK